MDESTSPCLKPQDIEHLLTGSLTAETRQRLEAHLSLCPRCREELAEQQDFDQLRQAFAARPPSVPPDLPPHQVRSRLGIGACGEVWLAHHPGLRQDRALKVLRPDRFGEAALAALREEGRMMAALKPHRNRVTVFDLVEQAGGAVLVMAYVAGGPLSKLAPLSWERAVRYVADAAEGLAEVHALGLLHRDIKPSNLLWDVERDTVLLADFGLAAHADRQEQHGWTCGYAAPEVLQGAAEARSDVFALAGTLYFLLTGQPLFPARQTAASLAEVRAGLPVPAPALAAHPRGVEEAIRAGLEPEVTRRPDLDTFRMLLRTAHSRELAQELRQRAERALGPVRLEVTVSLGDSQTKSLRPALTCGNRTAETPSVQVRTGDLVRIEATADTAGYVTVLNFASSGELNVLLPNSLAQDHRLPARRSARRDGADDAAARHRPRRRGLDARRGVVVRGTVARLDRRPGPEHEFRGPRSRHRGDGRLDRLGSDR